MSKRRRQDPRSKPQNGSCCVCGGPRDSQSQVVSDPFYIGSRGHYVCIQGKRGVEQVEGKSLCWDCWCESWTRQTAGDLWEYLIEALITKTPVRQICSDLGIKQTKFRQLRQILKCDSSYIRDWARVHGYAGI